MIFLLLIFFIVTSDILPLKSLNIEHPKIAKDTSPLTTQLLVVMDAQNVIYLGSRKDIVDLLSLKEQLLQEVGQIKRMHLGVEPTVVLSIDRRVDYGSFLKLFATAQECTSRIRLVYQTPDEERSGVF